MAASFLLKQMRLAGMYESEAAGEVAGHRKREPQAKSPPRPARNLQKKGMPNGTRGPSYTYCWPGRTSGVAGTVVLCWLKKEGGRLA